MHFNYMYVLPRIAAIGGQKYKVFKKLLFDQTIGATIFMSGFYITLSFLKGQNFMEGVNTLRQKFWKTLLLDQMWLPVSLTNFSLVPPNFQVQFANTFAVVYNTCLSYLAAQKTNPVEVAK